MSTCGCCNGDCYCARCDGWKIVDSDDSEYDLCPECHGDGYCLVCKGYGEIDDSYDDCPLDGGYDD
jgi:hypothetical protein